jgi:DNA-binding MarR family transcriptional regulator
MTRGIVIILNDHTNCHYDRFHFHIDNLRRHWETVFMASAIEDLVDEVRLLFHALVQRGDELHAEEAVTMGMRAILELLDRSGPASVPAMARARRVSRQHVQALVNPLLDLGYVSKAPNPAHKRSPLIRLTRPGEETIRRMRRREAAVLGSARALGEERIRATATALRAIRERIESDS